MKKTARTPAGTPSYLAGPLPAHLIRPRVQLQPVLAKEGRPNIDLKLLAERVRPVADIRPIIAIKSPEHWAEVIKNIGPDVDAILPVSIPAYPTEIWNSHPRPLVEKKIPFIFWPLLKYDEPDFWRWSAIDFLRTLGVDAVLLKNEMHGIAFLKALAVARYLKASKMVVFGKQNFPWNVPEAGHLCTESLGIRFTVKDIESYQSRYSKFDDAAVDKIWNERKARYLPKAVKTEWLRQAVRTYLAIKSVLEEEKAFGFGVNCFGDLVISGQRDVPCLAQTLLREDGYIASCDGDYLTLTGMALTTLMLDKTCLMSNMYPVGYVGALKDHFGGDPLSPDAKKYPKKTWANFARLGHCGFTGVVSPEMDINGRAELNDWGGTWEIKRDGRGCGNAGRLVGNTPMTAVQMKFDGKTVLLASVKCMETTLHKKMPHCESTALLKFRDLPGVVANISREHLSFVYGDHVEELKVLADVLKLNALIF
jgi:hypothetical protein